MGDCLGCGGRLRSFPRSPAAGLCGACYGEIPWISAPVCTRCGRNEACADCRRASSRSFEFSRSAVAYTPLMKEWLSAYKFRGNERWSEPFAHMLRHGFRLLLRRMMETGVGRPHALAFVPLSELRLRERGFNQAEQLARRLGEEVRLPVLDVLERHRHSDRQSWKSRKERVAGLRGAYRLSGEGRRLRQCLVDASSVAAFPDPSSGTLPERGKVWFPDRVQGVSIGCPDVTAPDQGQVGGPLPVSFNVVLVDDVYTTGATLGECARVLQRELGAKVFGLTWGR